MENEKISENIHTYIRIRPNIIEDNINITDNFYLTSSNDLINTNNNKINFNEISEGYYSYNINNNKEYKFKVDGIFNENNNQVEVYNIAVKPLVESVLKGFAATVFAYGPTGSGKTYTMMGDWTSDLKGIIPRVFDQLLKAREEYGDNCIITMSYLQIYCEVLTDLLDPRPVSLSIRESRRNGVFVENLSEIIIQSHSDVKDALDRGNNARATAATNSNATSSRSHAAILIKVITPDTINEKNKSDNRETNSKAIREGTLILVDLAGSERATAVAGRNYMRAEESKSINLSLSALGNCISALSKQQTNLTDDRDRAKYVPYRDSKLTRLLQGALGGGARTSVIVNVSPGPDPTNEVLNTLRFASRCSSISVVSKVHRSIDYETLYTQLLQKCDEYEQREREQQNEIEKQYEISEEQELKIEALKEECTVLRRELESLRQTTIESPRNKSSNQSLIEEQPEIQWTKKLEELSEQHLSELSTLRERYEQKVTAYKRSALESSQEIETLQSDIQRERERHLETLKDIRIVKERSAEMEREYEMRIQELLSELQNQTQKNELDDEQIISELKTELEKKDQQIMLLEDKIRGLENMSSCDMVSRSQVEEMESIFVDTINQLTARVLQLEEKKSNYNLYSSNSDDSVRNENHLPTVPPRGARIEPGKVRARTETNGWNNSNNNKQVHNNNNNSNNNNLNVSNIKNKGRF